MQGADRINDELEVGFDQRFEQRWVRAEQVGRGIMLVLVLAGLAGLFGRGPFSHRTKAAAEAGLSVDFEPVARAQAPTQVTFHIDNPSDSPEMQMFIGTNTVEPMGLQRVEPQPISTRAVQDGLALTLAIPPHTHNAEIRLMMQPVGLGENQLIVQLEGHPPLRWTQWVVP